MSKFVVLYLAPAGAWTEMAPEQRQKEMEAWMAWAARCGDQLVDMGSPLSGGQRLTASGSGPSGTDVTGYSMLEATDMAEAKALLDGHPHLGLEGGAIEVHESATMAM